MNTRMRMRMRMRKRWVAPLGCTLAVMALLAGGMTPPGLADDAGIKASMAAPAEAAYKTIQNDFITTSTDDDGQFVIGTTGGDPDIIGDENKPLTYGSPGNIWSSFTSVRIDGADTSLEDRTPATGPTKTGNKIETTWTVGDIAITQVLELVNNPYSGRNDITRITYRLRNNGGSSHNVGARCMLDVKVGYNDGAPYFVPGTGNTNTERSYSKSNMPAYYKSFESPVYAANSLKGQGILTGNGATTPDRFVIANWGSISSTIWDYSVTPGLETSDSAVAMYWGPASLTAGATRSYTTFYGLAGPGGGTSWIDAPVKAPCEGDCRFRADVWVSNTTDTPFTGGRTTITLPPGLELAPGEQATKDLGDVAAGEAGSVSFSIRPDGTVTGKLTYSAETTFTAGSGPLMAEADVEVVTCVEIAEPTEDDPADVGRRNAPRELTIWVVGVGRDDLEEQHFKVKIGSKEAKVIRVTYGDEFEDYEIRVQPPEQASGGPFDLEVEIIVDGVSLGKAKNKKVVRYGLRVDVVLVTDVTGSMRRKEGLPNRKVFHVLDAAAGFNNTLLAGDWVGIMGYNTRAPLPPMLVRPPAGRPPLHRLLAVPGGKNAVKTEINRFRNAITPWGAGGKGQLLVLVGGRTSIGRGLRLALAALNKDGQASHQWAMVLLTDGRQNMAPWAKAVVNNELLTARQPIHVHTVLFGRKDRKAVKLLKWIANTTSGTYNQAIIVKYSRPTEARAATTGSEPLFTDLTGAYMQAYEAIQGRQLLAHVEDVVDASATKQHTVRVDPSEEAVFFITWLNGDYDLELTLRTPGGTTIDPASAAPDPNITFVSGPALSYYRINDPAAGQWRMIIGGDPAIGPEGEPYAVYATGGLAPGVPNTTLHLTTAQPLYARGRPMQLKVNLSDDQPISANVQVDITMPDGTLHTVPLFDDGNHGDGEAGDGRYGNQFTQTGQSGVYRLRIRVSGTNNRGAQFTRLAEKTVPVMEPLDVSSTTETETAAPGGSVTFRINYENHTEQTLDNVVVRAEYDTRTSFQSATPPPSQGDNVWRESHLDPGQSKGIAVTLRLNAGLAAGTVLTNRVTVDSDQTDPVTTETTVTVAGPPVHILPVFYPDGGPADGRSDLGVYIGVSDALGNPVADGTEVRLTIDVGTFPDDATTCITTTQGGLVFVPVTPPTSPGTATVIARSGDASDQGQAEFRPVSEWHLPLALNDHQPPAPPPPPVLYEDDFSDPGSGWHVADSDTALWEYRNGEFRIKVKPTDWWAGSRVPGGLLFGDCAIEVDARFATTVYGQYGIFYGLNDDWGEFYWFSVSGDGRYRVRKHNADGWHTLVNWTSSSHIKQGQQSNHLKIVRQGAQVKLYANGHYLKTVTDSEFTGSRRVALATGTLSEANVDARFDNLRITGLTAGATGLLGVEEGTAIGEGRQ